MVFLSSRQVYGGTAEHLMAYKINISPPRDIWVLVDAENGVYFKQVRHKTFGSMQSNQP